MMSPAFTIAKVIGLDHVRSGKPCQDEVGSVTVGGRTAVVISDGHGSSAHADVGARLAVTFTLHALLVFAEQFGEQPLEALHSYAKHPLRRNIVRAWVDAVGNHGQGDRADLRAHGATLGFALSLPNALIIGGIGDCDVLLVDRDGTVTQPIQARDHPGEQTSSLSQTDGSMEFDIVGLPPPRSETLLILTTDGYRKSYTTDEGFEAIGPDYLGRIREKGLEKVAATLESILTKTTAQGSEDDISVAMLYWPPGTVATSNSAQPDPPAGQSAAGPSTEAATGIAADGTSAAGRDTVASALDADAQHEGGPAYGPPGDAAADPSAGAGASASSARHETD